MSELELFRLREQLAAQERRDMLLAGPHVPHVITLDLTVGPMEDAEILYTLWDRRVTIAHAAWRASHPGARIPPPTELDNMIEYSWGELPKISKDFWTSLLADFMKVKAARRANNLP